MVEQYKMTKTPSLLPEPEAQFYLFFSERMGLLQIVLLHSDKVSVGKAKLIFNITIDAA